MKRIKKINIFSIIIAQAFIFNDLRSEPLKIADYNAFLSNGSVNEKIMAARDLGNMSSSAIKSIPNLVAALESDSDHEVKMEVIRAIERIGGDANLSVPSLVNALNDTRPEIRWAAAGALVSFGKKSVIAVPALVNLLDDEEKYVRSAAAGTLGKMGNVAAKALVALADKKKDTNEKLTISCIKSLGALGSYAFSSVPFLIKISSSLNEQIRLESIKSLRKIGADKSFPGEIGWVVEPSERVWPKAAVSAVRHQKQPILRAEMEKKISQILIQHINDKNIEIQYQSLKGLSALGKYASPAKPSLINLLGSTDPRIRKASSEVLGAMDESGHVAIPDLVDALADLDDSVKWAASRALINFGVHSLPELIYILENEDSDYYPGILNTLGGIGINASEAAPYVSNLIFSNDPMIRVLVIETLGKISDREDKIISTLESALNDDYQEVRDAAKWALNKIKNYNKDYQ